MPSVPCTIRNCSVLTLHEMKSVDPFSDIVLYVVSDQIEIFSSTYDGLLRWTLFSAMDDLISETWLIVFVNIFSSIYDWVLPKNFSILSRFKVPIFLSSIYLGFESRPLGYFETPKFPFSNKVFFTKNSSRYFELENYNLILQTSSKH